MHTYTSSTRARWGGSCLRVRLYTITPFSSIELARAVRQPGPCVFALCDSDTLFQRSHLKLHTSHFTPRSSHIIRRTYTSHFALHTSSHLIWALLNSSQLFCTSESFYCQRVSCTQEPLRAESCFCTQKLEIQMRLHRKAWPLHTESLCTWEVFNIFTQHAFIQRSLYTEKLLHRSFYTARFYTEKLLHTASFCTEKLLQFYTEKLRSEAFTQKSL